MWAGYIITVVLEIAVTGMLLVLEPYLPLSRFPISYILVMMLVASMFGEGPAIVAFVLGLMAFDYYFLTSHHSIWPIADTPAALAGLAAFLIGTLIAGFATIRMRRSNQRIQQMADELIYNADRLSLATSAANIGTWNWDLVRDELVWDDRCKALFGLAPDARMTYPSFLNSLHPSDRERNDSTIRRAIIEHTEYDIEYRIIWPNGTVRRILSKGRSSYDSAGNPVRMSGIVIDITKLRKAEEALANVEEHRLSFYRRLILAATNGKFIITELSNIKEMAGPCLADWTITGEQDLSSIRHDIAELAEREGMKAPHLEKFVMCMGEAATNALTHGGGGRVSLHRLPDSLMITVSDAGPGIAALNLPDVALRHGYTTAGTLGMGYKVIISFADRAYLATGTDGTTVAISMKLYPSEAELAAHLNPTGM